MKPTVLAILLATLTPAAAGSLLEVRTIDHHAGTIAVHASGASMHAFLRTIELRTGRTIVPDFEDFRFRADISGGNPLETLKAVAASLDLELVEKGRLLIVRDSNDQRVQLNLVDVAATSIVGQLARQCGIRNVMMDSAIEARGTFVFDDVPCSTAFRTVFDSLGLDGSLEPSSVLVVERRR